MVISSFSTSGGDDVHGKTLGMKVQVIAGAVALVAALSAHALAQ